MSDSSPCLDLHSLGLIHADLKPDNIAFKSGECVCTKYYDPSFGGFRPHV